MADRVGVANHGEIVLVEEKTALMRKLGSKQLTFDLRAPLKQIPDTLKRYKLRLINGGDGLVYTYDTKANRTGITALMTDLADAGITFSDIVTEQSSLEDIFVNLVRKKDR